MGGRYILYALFVILFATGFLVASIDTYADEDIYSVPIFASYSGGVTIYEYMAVNPFEVFLESNYYGTLTQRFYGEEFYVEMAPELIVDVDNGLSVLPVTYYISADPHGVGSFSCYIKSYRVLIGLKISETNSFPENAIKSIIHSELLTPSTVSVSLGLGEVFTVALSTELECPSYTIYVAHPGTEGYYLWEWNGFVFIGSWFSSHPLGHKGTIEWTFAQAPQNKYIDVAGVVRISLEEGIMENHINNNVQVYILEEVE
ncbi:MAG: hypothetical protein DRJ64_06125 [Thermoprotei archaeon]|nr:MAG: hypothetical protein DRJ64_06125 [Thermoprotei archaeon]